MSRGRASGRRVQRADVPIILGMAARGDHDHNIAAWFGLNQGRIAEAKNGEHGQASPAPSHQLPSKGPPGIKGRRLRDDVASVLTAMEKMGKKESEFIRCSSVPRVNMTPMKDS